ncbi:MAG TPA: zinc-dependent alcohol dehydrogenase family protein [Tepidisphaeraceae bacterium]|jgi:propanol-preferring alcohol dehydrogenase|nr:zinc-dependent alcohol dehydrogenase family protein [Tepidisphaeraceae bacterium]
MKMRAMVLKSPASIDSSPLELREIEAPEPKAGEVRVRVLACAICRTDLHVVEGELPPRKHGIIPGHQVVGVVDQMGAGSGRFKIGDRVGIAWLRYTCGQCQYCRAAKENLCPNARFTGYDEDGGYAEYAVVREDFAYPLPASVDAAGVSPLLCAGIIGYRALARAEMRPGCRLGLYGFGSSASIGIQIARHLGCSVYVMTRDQKHQALARELGATWAGGASQPPPEPLDSAVLFAPVGTLVLPALEALDRGGTLAIAGIHLSDIPVLNYDRHLFQEKNLRSVTANTREDGKALLRLGAEIPLKPQTTRFPLAQANEALRALKHDGINGSGVLEVSTRNGV